MTQALRPYQVKAVDDLRKVFASGTRSAILVCPTGGGKTTIAADIIHKLKAANNRADFIAHRKELIDQCSKRLDQHGIDHGIIKAGNKRRNNGPIQVASVQTLIRRLEPKEGDLIGFRRKVDLIIIDECHRALANSYLKVLEHWPEARVLGLTATPVRTDGRGLGDLFETIVEASTVAELTGMGFLVPARTFTTPYKPDYTGVKKNRDGDYNEAQAEAVVNTDELVGKIYENWKAKASDRKTVIFAVSCKHARHIRDVFLAAGESIEYLDGDMKDEERDAILARHASGETQIVVNVGILTEGWDNPEVSCVVLARKTESLALYLQMCGRGLRTAEWVGKVDCIILDHGGNVDRPGFGFVSDDREWSLEGRKSKNKSETPLTTCDKCYAVYRSSFDACPECGHERPRKVQQERIAVPGEAIAELVERNASAVRASEAEFFETALRNQEMFGYKPGYAKAKFFDQFDRWPGKEIGLKPVWNREDQGNGKKRFVIEAYKFKGRTIPAGVIDSRRDSGNVRSAAGVAAVASEYW